MKLKLDDLDFCLTNFMCRPSEEIRRHNLALIEIALGPSPADGTNESGKHRWAAALDLLKVDNGSWSDPQCITHHCGGRFCCPNGLKETRAKLWVAILVARLRLVRVTVTF